MELYIFNNLTKQKELFKPITKNHIGMYVCGPTVSGESHLGHARPFITFDIIYRFFLFNNYKVRYVRNITDAGHFEEEGREAEDKINTKAILEKIEPMELVQKYTNLFHDAMKKFNCLEPTIEPTATGHIIEQIEMIEDIINKGFAYIVNGSVYFDVKKYSQINNYGILSKRKLEDLLENTRLLEAQEEKKNSVDFALWKKSPEKHLMKWKSPWGYGFPGWHIECSAMSSKYLGKKFDIHGGGMDLQFPHHECEIAQSTICNNEMPANYWLHNNMITINGKKMGKSYNNVIKLSELFTGTHPLISKPIAPSTIRFFILQTHYSSTLDFSEEALISSEKALQRIWFAYQTLLNFNDTNFKNNIETELDKKINDYLNKMDNDILDDFNTAKVLASMFEIIPNINGLQNKNISNNEITLNTIINLKKYFKKYLEDIFGLKYESNINENKYLKGTMDILLEIRNNAKANRNFEVSDKIRIQLQNLGIKIKDNKEGNTEWTL